MFFPDKDSLFLQILYIFAKQWHMLRFNHTTENMKTKTLLGFFLLSLMTFVYQPVKMMQRLFYLAVPN